MSVTLRLCVMQERHDQPAPGGVVVAAAEADLLYVIPSWNQPAQPVEASHHVL